MLPKLIGITERYGHTFYSAWIADTRSDGVGRSAQTSFRNPLRLFVADIGDRLRTNMRSEAGFPPDRTATILETGFHVSFTRQPDYQLFFKDNFMHRGSSITISVLGNAVHKIDTDDFLWPDKNGEAPAPSYKWGIRVSQKPPQPIHIPPRASFYATLETSDQFTERMLALESGMSEGEYAEVKCFIKTLATREVQ